MRRAFRHFGLQCALACAVVATVAVTIAGRQRGPESSGEISGTVLTTAAPATPMARVLVTISAPSLKPSRTVITDAQGRFTFTGLPPGNYSVVAARPSFVTTAFGAKRPGRPGTPIDLAANQHVTGISIRLARGAAVTGLIRNAAGETAPGIKVEAVPLDSQANAIRFAAMTDDRGMYRIFGLPPGKYIVTANNSETAGGGLTQITDAEVDAIIARLQRRSTVLPAPAPVAPPSRGTGQLPIEGPRDVTYADAPIHYPGTPDIALATPLSLAEDEERTGVDIALQFVRAATIDGRVSMTTGGLPPATSLTLTRLLPGNETIISARFQTPTQSPDVTGKFRFASVFPGRYRVLARSMTATGAFFALADVTISGTDVTGLAMTLQPGIRVSGRFGFNNGAQAPPQDLSKFRLQLFDVSGLSSIVPQGVARADGTFEITGILPGAYSVRASADAGWWLRSVTVDGRDMLDFPLDLGGTGDVSGVVATFTNQHSEIAGTLQLATNVPAPDYFVVVFSADRTFWRPASRRVQFTRPNTDGRFSFRDLPSGDYLIAALTDMEPDDLRDSSFIGGLVSAGVPVHINDGEMKTQNLQVVR